MYFFSTTSKERLATCDSLIVKVMIEAIQYDIDFTVICGHRNEEDQNKAFAGGFSGLKFPSSKHNSYLSLAVDIAPYFKEKPHIRWEDINGFYRLNGVIQTIAAQSNVKLTWGGDWNSRDYPHYQLVGEER